MEIFSGTSEDSIYQQLPHHFLITDSNSSIECVSKGLYEEVGLSSKFFGKHETSKINLEKLFGIDITSLEVFE